MKIQELRIGNIVGVNIFERHFGSCLLQCRITGVIHDETESLVRIGYYDEGSSRHYYRIIAPHEVIPIPLTEELLLMCGGKLFPNGFGTKKIVFDLNIRLGFSIEFVTDRAGDVVIGAILNGNSTLVKFLHQLQNLFFALTGEELKVNI